MEDTKNLEEKLGGIGILLETLGITNLKKLKEKKEELKGIDGHIVESIEEVKDSIYRGKLERGVYDITMRAPNDMRYINRVHTFPENIARIPPNFSRSIYDKDE